ncbi:MAG TPA: hypothetical protein VMB52_02095 [Verrucomicrobiae bacterium]|nr:hypothetical protein [Verrucomicrobiae bacterium]
MKQKPQSRATSKDAPAARKRRLQQRLRELNEHNEREMNALMKSVERIKSAFRSKRSSKSS